jgi:hypothetical protein
MPLRRCFEGMGSSWTSDKRMDPTRPGTTCDHAMEVPELTIEVASRREAGDILVSPQRCAEITCLVSIGDSHDGLPAGYDNVPASCACSSPTS